VSDQPAYDVVRCSRVGDDGSCGREQAVVTRDDGVGVRVVLTVSDASAAWLSDIGWRRVDGGRWLCPFCSVAAGLWGGSL